MSLAGLLQWLDTRFGSPAINALKNSQLDHWFDDSSSASLLQEPLLAGIAGQRSQPLINGRVLAFGVVAIIAVVLGAALLNMRQDTIVTDHFKAAVATPGTDEETQEAVEESLVYEPGSDWPLPETHWTSYDAAQKLRARLDDLEDRATALRDEQAGNSDPERAEQIKIEAQALHDEILALREAADRFYRAYLEGNSALVTEGDSLKYSSEKANFWVQWIESNLLE